ncbi:MAG: DUF5710 domain-containing protein [Longimicrobiaceae bacterium]|jgi:hypothetical protein
MTARAERINLAVPYPERTAAKELGARWDGARKTWYVPAGVDPAPFRRWLPAAEIESNLVALAPVYLALSAQPCWRCSNQVDVVALGVLRFRDLAAEAEQEGETGRAYNFEGEGGWVAMPADTLHLLTHVARLPDRAVEAIRQRAPRFRLDVSKAAGRYYMNHCQACGAHLGDYFMHSEPGGAFYPTTAEELDRIAFTELGVRGELAIRTDVVYSSSVADRFEALCRR